MSISSLMFLIIFIPLIGSIFVLSTKDNMRETFKNTEQVALLTVFVDILLLLTLFSATDIASHNIQHKLELSWGFFSTFKFSFGIDVQSLMFLLGIQISAFVGILGIRKNKQTPKSVLFYTLLYLFCLNGYFTAQDVLSLYIFYTSSLFPLYMLIGLTLDMRQHKMLLRLALHHFLGSILFFASVILIIDSNEQNILINALDTLKLSKNEAIWIWASLFSAFILRMPVWPFHHAITSVSVSLKNPLAFIALHIMPISGIYGVMRCWPLNIPIEIEMFSPILQMLCLLTMIFTSAGGYIYSNTPQKLYNYVLVYDLSYLLAVFLPTDIIATNITYSVFSFLLISSSLIVLQAHILEQSVRSNTSIKGILRFMPKASVSYFLFTMAAIGLPVSAFFWNNFMIVSEIFNFNLYSGTLVMLAMMLAGIALLQSLYTLKNETTSIDPDIKIKDIDAYTFCISLMLICALLLSLLKPFWFVL